MPDKSMTLERARAVIQAHERAGKAAKRAEVEARCVGRYFKYRNRYGDDSSWWLYMSVTSVEEWSCACRGVQFQRDCNGQVTIEPKARAYIHADDANWKPISRAQFRRAARSVADAVLATLGADDE